MRRLGRIARLWPAAAAGGVNRRDRIAAICAYATLAAVVCVFLASKDPGFLMPGPMTSAHGAIEACGTCHTKSGSGKLSWIHGLVAGDPLADSKACLSCHKMPETALNAHGASRDVLKRNTERLLNVAAASLPPLSMRAQSYAFPADAIAGGNLYCATCHQEHQGGSVKPTNLSNAQCQSCHAIKFDSFGSGHPKFDGYPFKRRTRIVYDHATHFNKHYPEVAKKDAAKRIPRACSTCHTSDGDNRVMTVAAFEETCAACHADQISGKERVSGPKGIAFLSLPGLDLETLKKKNAALGEWPEASEAALSPFTAFMISRTEKGRGLIKAVKGLNLQDLSGASNQQLQAVAELGWEIKKLVFAIVSGKASDALGQIKSDAGRDRQPALASDLTARLPRAVVVAAQQQWLPNLAAEMAKGPGATLAAPAAVTEPEPEAPADPEQPSQSGEPPEPTTEAATREANEAVAPVKRDPPACLVRVFGQCLVTKGPSEAVDEAPSQGFTSQTDTANAKAEAGEGAKPRSGLPGAMRAGLTSLDQNTRLAQSTQKAESSPAPAGDRALPTGKVPAAADELLFPTADERRDIDAHNKASGKKVAPAGAAPGPAGSNPGGGGAPSSQQPGPNVEDDVDPEAWADNGGWYQQDYAIFYRPAGHKDTFLTSWLTLTAPAGGEGASNPSAAIFEALTHKDAQGSCTKCHSVDAAQGKGKAVNFSPLTAGQKSGQFTRFVHEPHFRVTGDRGCTTCHELEKGKPYLKSYEQGDPRAFAPQFSSVSKDRCQSCHTTGKARQDCLLCHTYHVNGVKTPITETKLPAQ